MDNESNNKKYVPIILVLVSVLVLILIAFLSGWVFSRNNDNAEQPTQQQPITNQQETNTINTSVDQLVSYTLPSSWNTRICEGSEDKVYLVQNDTVPDCNVNPAYSLSLSVDSQSRTDCNQLQNVQNVSKHICKTIFIDGLKTLEAETVYNQDSDVLPGKTVRSYYMDTGKGVIIARYIYSGGNGTDGTAFNDIVQSLKLK